MDYSDYTVNDFITDEYFQQWVKREDETTDLFWKTWLEKHPEKRPVVREAISVLQALDFREIPADSGEKEKVRQKIKEQIKGNRLHRFSVTSGKSESTIRWQFSFKKAAAMIATLIMLGIAYFLFVAKERVTEYTTAHGEIRNIELPDGSEVMLNANSRLELSPDWQRSREVWLEGEGFFEVKEIQDTNNSPFGKKFMVHTNQLDVQVLGTVFNVNERRGVTSVILKRGKIRLSGLLHPETKQLLMEPGEMVKYREEDHQLTQKKVNPELHTAWKDQKFVFDGTSLQAIGRMLEDNYGYKVLIKDPELLDRKFTANLPERDVDFLLEMLEELMEIKVERQGDLIIIKHPKNNKNTASS